MEILKQTQLLLFTFLLLAPALGSASDYPDVHYEVTFLPQSQSAKVEITIADAQWLSSVLLRPLAHTQGEIEGNGKIKKEGKNRRWYPPGKKAKLEYTVKLDIERNGGGYDALVTENWALMRGEDLFPSFRAKKNKGAVGQTFISFVLPQHWTSVNTGWRQIAENKFVINNDDRAMPRPQGWLIAGQLGTRKEKLADTQLTISAPRGQNFRQMEALAFFGMVWPNLLDTFEVLPRDLLITGAADPMWRGGLSSPTSFYVHADRPLISENGTSTHLHELVHVVTGIHAASGYDWIVEGLAEYYSVEFLYRAGAYTDTRREDIFEGLAEWGKDVSSLQRRVSFGPYTARAAVVFDQLNSELLECSDGTKNIDVIMRAVNDNKSITLSDLRSAYEEHCSRASEVLSTELVGA